ncbi:MAG: hypothetical protein RLZZ362_945, partial [Actinomycetota bacterium]
NPFERPEPWFPADVMDLDGQMLGLGVQVQARVGRRGVQGEVVGWRAPDRIRILTEALHLHTVPLQAIRVEFVQPTEDR